MLITCGHCGVRVDAKVVAQVSTSQGMAQFLQCPSCMDGSVMTATGVVYPPAPAGGMVSGLPLDVEQAWREARTAHAVGACTAAEIMCRKILMHLAVDVTKSKPGKKFVEYVDDLEKAGYVTPGAKPVIDSVRGRGNTAAHELPASTEQDSRTTMAITEHLLRTIYELPGLVTTL